MTSAAREPAPAVRLAVLRDPMERDRIDDFLDSRPEATPFHSRVWLEAIEAATGHPAHVLLGEERGRIVGLLPLHRATSLFGAALVSTGFAVGGGILAETPRAAALLARSAEELAARLACPAIELRGGVVPVARDGWRARRDTHAGFVAPLAADDAAQLVAIPRKQRAEVRKGLANALEVRIGNGSAERAMHYAVYAESVRNLGTPVFPKALFSAVLDGFGTDADILTVLDRGRPVASVLSLYHRGAVMPYWGGGAAAARHLRANDAMYFALMRHARERGCDSFDFGRSKIGSGAYQYKRNWGFEPQPLAYAAWTADGAAPRDADPTSPRYEAAIAAWKRLPLPLANRLGLLISRGLV
ncbi:FemAB family XrtA/PEP-CTERM system-associated protein [Novosphingobium sp. Gsoil 351]|uniref:FemAB family XrtA/PEP-CTERM system-associated protein n=1 Tax=Novosphingobium sp. Gsoil 351 TaxID=2675225 RepID=UPI0012B4D270|nr:FemAB family XrtA/PEP-CTERM system-associated protein [Novosphingobium sp. Gsoil 351]QGN53209.1 FemAB family PEP-CTERM system-associated protein [Novosphingobium sp. Gsoil 351]